MGLLRRGICAPHSSGEQFPTTYDADGNVCPSVTDSDRITIGVGLGLCAMILFIIAVFWVISYTREKLDKEKDESHARSSLQPMVKMDYKSYLSPPGSQSSSQPPSQPSSDSSHSDHTHYSIVEEYSLPERTRPEQFVPPRQPPAISMVEGSKQYSSPSSSSSMICGPPPRSSSHSSRLDQHSGQHSLAQAGMAVDQSPRKPAQPIKNPQLRINTARAQRSISPTYQVQRPTSPLGPGCASPVSANASPVHAFSPVSPMGGYPPLSPTPLVHMASAPITLPVRAVAPATRVNPMAAPIAPAMATSGVSSNSKAANYGQVSASEPASDSAGMAGRGSGNGIPGLSVVGPAIPVMLAQAPMRSTSLDSRTAGPATPISPNIQTPSGAMQFPFSALSPPGSPKQVFSPGSHEMDEYFDAQAVDQIIRDAPQGQDVIAQSAPDVQGYTASVYGYRSPIPSSSPERLPYLGPTESELLEYDRQMVGATDKAIRRDSETTITPLADGSDI